MFQILIVEPETPSREKLREQAETAGYSVLCAASAAAALRHIEHIPADLVLISQTSSQFSAVSLIFQLRNAGFTRPILLLCREKELAKSALRAGADDAIAYPVDSEELFLRIDALFRRANLQNRHILQIGKVTLYYDQFLVTRENTRLFLPRKEFLLLYYLLSYPSRIFTREQLMNEIWGPDSNSISTTVNVHVNRLRTRFRGWKEFEIVTVRGMGYKAVLHGDKKSRSAAARTR